MEKDNRDQIAEQFADLTGKLEGAAELAVSGQSLKLSNPVIKLLSGNLRQQLTTCSEALKFIERQFRG